MKRSRRVVLTLMGSAAVGAVSMGLVPRHGLRPRQYGRARPGRQALLPRDLSAASAVRRVDCTAMVMAAMVTAATAGGLSMRRIACPERDDWRDDRRSSRI